MLYSHSKGDVGEAYNANVKQKAKKYRQVLQTFGRKSFPRIFSFLYKKNKILQRCTSSRGCCGLSLKVFLRMFGLESGLSYTGTSDPKWCLLEGCRVNYVRKGDNF